MSRKDSPIDRYEGRKPSGGNAQVGRRFISGETSRHIESFNYRKKTGRCDAVDLLVPQNLRASSGDMSRV